MKTALLFAFALVFLISCKPKNENCIEGDCFNGVGKEKTFVDDVYEGSFKNGKRHGKGKLYSEIFDVTYTGTFVNGKLEGKVVAIHGSESVSPGAVFKGQFKKGKENGRGKLTYSDYDPDFPYEEYVGEWKNGGITGKGRYTWPDGGWAEGDFVNGYIHGEAKRYWPYSEEDDTDAQTYTGGWVANLQDGYGVLVWESGEKYEGEWKEGVFHGKGKYTLDTGDVFEGEWIDGESEAFDDFVDEVYW